MTSTMRAALSGAGARMRHLLIGAALAALAAGLPQGLRAESVTLSTSNPAAAAIAGQMAAMMGAERAALGAVSADHLGSLARPVQPPPGAGLFSRRDRGPQPNVFTAAMLDRMERAEGDADWHCLATAIYHEARGESIEGQFAVAEVILNRVDSPRFPATICRVVNQGASTPGGCQFSYACDGRSTAMREPRARDRAGKIARLMIDGATRHRTAGAEFFHARHVSPGWSRVFKPTARIGAHVFYVEQLSIAGN